MIPRSVIGYVIFTSLFIKGQYRSKMIIKKNPPKSPKTTEVQWSKIVVDRICTVLCAISRDSKGFYIYIYIYIWSCGGSEWYIMTRRSHTYIHIHIEIFWLSESDHAQYYIIHFNAELVVHSPSNFLPFPLISMNKFWGQRPQNSYGGSGWYSTTRRSHTYI